MSKGKLRKGKLLTVAEAKKIAEAGGAAWAELYTFDPYDADYSGPVTFEEAALGYYVNAVNDDVKKDEEMASALLSEALGEDIPVSFAITDFVPEDWKDNEKVFDEFGEGTFALYELIQDKS